MCGIAGYAGSNRHELLEPMCRAMSHRGPDDEGIWHDEDVGLGHRRLSIIDPTPAGHQPMSDALGQVWITYNGEIYNFLELRRDLEARGYRFRSKTDTEVLVYLYLAEGPDFLKRLNGMFALAIWDVRRRTLLLARDHVGIKPLYYWQDGKRLFFASEIKALLEVPELRPGVNHRLIPSYLALLWVPGSETMLQDVMKLEPGERLTWNDGDVSKDKWFSLEYEPDETAPDGQWAPMLRDSFMETVRRQMVSDVPLGAFLSGGVDSSSIVAAMRDAYPDREISCYSVDFASADMRRDQFEEDLPYARRVAEDLRVDLKTVPIDSSALSLLPDLIYQLDEPDADPAIIPTYLISRLAREDGTTVLLSGTGGDEVFFGYRSHLAYRLYETLDRVPLTKSGLRTAAWIAERGGAQTALARRLRKLSRAQEATGIDRHMAVVAWSTAATRTEILSDDLLAEVDREGDPAAMLAPYYNGFRGTGELNRHSHVLIQTFLASHNFLYSDKMSMAASVELRVPFVDVELMRFAARIPEHIKLPGRNLKGLLKHAMADHLPPYVASRSKTGFMLPIREWLVADLRPLVRETLSPEQIRWQGLFSPEAVERAVADNEANRSDHAYLLYALLTFQIWMSQFVKQ
jgi:asparagine synthase (glutamine-hydrolysing)